MTPREPVRHHDRGIGARLHVDGGEGTSRAALTGRWDPHSTSLEAELPWLVTELQRRGFRVLRVAYNPTRWDDAPRTAHADGRVVRLGLRRTLAPNLLVLQGAHGERLDLIVPTAA